MLHPMTSLDNDDEARHQRITIQCRYPCTHCKCTTLLVPTMDKSYDLQVFLLDSVACVCHFGGFWLFTVHQAKTSSSVFAHSPHRTSHIPQSRPFLYHSARQNVGILHPPAPQSHSTSISLQKALPLVHFPNCSSHSPVEVRTYQLVVIASACVCIFIDIVCRDILTK